MSASEIANDKFELVIGMEGTIESTSMTFQARTSYLPHEILWGHRFEPMMLYRRDHNKYQVNFAAFNSTYEVDTPLWSARDLDLFKSQEAADSVKPLLMGSPLLHPGSRQNGSYLAPVPERIETMSTSMRTATPDRVVEIKQADKASSSSEDEADDDNKSVENELQP